MTRVFFDRSLHQTTSLSYKKLNTNYLVYKTQSDFSLPPIMSWIKTCHTIPQFAGLNFVTVFLFICTTHHLLNSSPEKRNHLETPLCSPMITKQEIIDECTSVKDIRDSSGKNRKIYHYFVTFMVSSKWLIVIYQTSFISDRCGNIALYYQFVWFMHVHTRVLEYQINVQQILFWFWVLAYLPTRLFITTCTKKREGRIFYYLFTTYTLIWSTRLFGSLEN